MNEIKTFSNDMFSILIKQDNENNLFDLETVAKSLGFTQFKNGKQYIRWETINKYLGKYLSQEVGKGDFIPEPMVYKLAFKAGNAVAEKFQDWLAMEVLPAIRKHGIYATDNVIEQTLKDPDYIITVLTEYKKEKEQNLLLQQQVEVNKPKVLFADSVAGSDNSILVGELAKILKQNGVDIGQNRLFKWLRNNGYLIKKSGESYNLPTQKSMDLKILDIKKRIINNPDGSSKVSRTPKVTGKGQQYFVNKFLGEKQTT
ncbi:TPA: phage antirepressor KilAC domain-containing protein [Staphylococcus aureus]|uniref:phage antirepressor KilAC domain-containing protein n=1 Tax=Staphylococcus aureus TaxID=1280 RepID=UPI0009102E2C|nr:phage antirepressor KilAC domain-containing protein [Staphylococcus aureus]MCS4725189.1 phage antirepressor KilAC domain-containing protein [Staphylococcus aureus]SGT34550.1 Antirepressor [Staphylococcus aureus]HAR4280007.1 phage antirepressor Ant [Staphylococcus aureus]HCW7521478.1 phage antirepressor KilAC domain-containing protein [Staphylococcus aureus]HCY2829575.1 phage antirepressor KilAC domain-containing protein [Staphylococcus aureus]